MMTVEEAKKADLSNDERIILGSSIYAGRMQGGKILDQYQDKDLYIFTVGLALPSDTDYQPTYQVSLSQPLIQKAKFYNFQSGMDYKKLSLLDKILMFGIKKFKFDKIPESQWDSSFKTMMDPYFDSFDLMELNQVQPLIEDLKENK